LLAFAAASAKTYETRAAALQRVFGADAEIERKTVFLTEAQIETVQTRARARVEHARITFYEAVRADEQLGRAYLDTHLVRSLYETLLVAVDPDGRTRNVDILAFHEPEDYLPPPRWLRTLENRTLSRRLRPGDEVDAISGATLSARAAAAAVRRVLAIDRVLQGEQP
jgi:transcriptional regulator of nitric oxide reductase